MGENNEYEDHQGSWVFRFFKYGERPTDPPKKEPFLRAMLPVLVSERSDYKVTIGPFIFGQN